MYVDIWYVESTFRCTTIETKQNKENFMQTRGIIKTTTKKTKKIKSQYERMNGRCRQINGNTRMQGLHFEIQTNAGAPQREINLNDKLVIFVFFFFF